MAIRDLDTFSLITGKTKNLHHYYGDFVRGVFLTGSVAVLLSLPLFVHILASSILYPVVTIAVLVISAGLANPAPRGAMIFNIIVSAGAVIFFEYQALLAWRMSDHVDWHQNFLFIESHVLALLFLFALYYSIKTVRGRFLKKHIVDEE